MAGPKITIEPAEGVWAVRAQGAVVGETRRALRLIEGDLPPVIYIPREDLQMVFFERSETTSSCPWKGKAVYFNLHGKSRVLPDVAWSYENPRPEVAAIAGHLAFYPDEVTVEIVS